MQARAEHAAVILVAALVAAGCGASVTKAEPREQAAVRVATVPITERDVPRERWLTGSLRANREATVAATGAGRVLSASFERGDEVAGGAVLARLDARAVAAGAAEARAAADAARVQLGLARSECARADRLLAVGAIGRAEHERLAASCSAGAGSTRAADARAHLSAVAASDALVRAPFAGMIAERLLGEGDFAVPGRPVATIVETDPLRFEISVPEAALADVHVGQAVALEVTARPRETFTGAIRWIGPAVRRSSRDVVAEAVVPNPDRRLAPGMFALARVALGTRRALVVPRSAVRRGDASARIWVVSAGHAEERIVALGPELGSVIVIESGARAGERVVTGPSARIRDGIAVR